MAGAALISAAAIIAGSCTSTDTAAEGTTLPTDDSGAAGEPGDPTSATTATSIADAVAVDDEPLGGINGSALEQQHGQAVALVITRSCDGMGYSMGSAFAVGPRTLVTNWHVVAEDYNSDDSAIDPRPWILTYNRRWTRGTVVGATPTPDIAVIQIDDTEPAMAETLGWKDGDVSDGEHLAILGYPGLESGEFNLAVGKSAESDGQTDGVPSFRIDRLLSARTGPGNSGGPVLTADGSVAGVLTWGYMSRSTWFAQDATVAREAAESILDDPRPVPTACDADSTDRYPLAYTVRLGTFADEGDAERRLEVVDGVRDDVQVITVPSDPWKPFLLSDYPIVMMAGPFDTPDAATAAVADYQAAIDAAGQIDRFSVGVMPRSVFGAAEQERIDQGCGDLSSSTVSVSGVTPADPLKLRAEPSTSADVLAELDDGQILALLTDPTVEANGLEWLHVQYDGDDEPLCGWVARNYTTMP